MRFHSKILDEIGMTKDKEGEMRKKGVEEREDGGKKILHFVVTFSRQYFYFINDVKFTLTGKTILVIFKT